MQKRFVINEKPLPDSAADRHPDIGGQISKNIKKDAKLNLALEKMTEDREQWEKKWLREILEIADSLERVLYQADKLPQDDAVSRIAGYVRTTSRQLSQILNRWEITPLEVLGQTANPELTEIVDIIEKEGCQDEEVVAEIEKGYLYRGKLLRRARVIIARKKEN